jgi:hypothetical protein
MKNMVRHQTSAIAIQVPSTRSSGCFHQILVLGGSSELIKASPLMEECAAGYLAIGMVTISITPQRM